MLGVLNGLNINLEAGEFGKFALELLKLRVVVVELAESIVDSVFPEPVETTEVIQESEDSSSSTLNGTSKKQDDLDNFLILGNPSVEWVSFLLGSVLLAPVLHILGGLENVRGSSVDSRLDLIQSWLESASVLILVKLHIDLEEGLQDLLGHVSSTADSLLHLVERVLGSVQESLIHGPVVVLAQLLDLFSTDWLDVLIKLVRADGLDKILDGTFDLVVLALELLRLFLDPLLLHLDELIKSEGLGILWKVDKDSLGKRLEVVLNSVFHDVVDVDDQLLEFGQTGVDVSKVSINVHGGPGKSNHTGSQFVLQILEVRHKKRLGVGSDLVHNSVVLTKHKLQLVLVSLELVLLKEHNLGRLWDVNRSNSRKALGLSDEGHDLSVEVDVELVVLWVSDDEGCLQTGLSLVNLSNPLLSPEVLITEESVADLVVLLNEALAVLLLDKVLWELLHWDSQSVEQVTSPGNGTRSRGQVSAKWWIVLAVLVVSLDLVDLTTIVLEQKLVFGVKTTSQVVSVQDGFELAEELQGISD